MYRPHAALLSLLLVLVFALPLTAAAPTAGNVVAEIEPAPDPSAAPAHQSFAYGPILTEDPDARVRIKQLYREQYDLELVVQERIAELNAAVAAEADPDTRLQLRRDTMALKESHLVQLTEIGLEIARLNGDESRVAEYELALDQMRHPERYLPATKDPADAARERARDAGLE